MKSSTTRIALGVLALGSVGFLLSSPGNATVRTEACGTISTLQNGSFESGSTSFMNSGNLPISGSAFSNEFN